MGKTYEYLIILSFGWSHWREDDKTIFEFPWAILNTQTLEVTESNVLRINPAHSVNSNVSPARLTLAGLTSQDLESGIKFTEAVQKFDEFIYQNFISANKSFCLVVENSWDLTYCFLDEALLHQLRLGPHYTRFFDLSKEFHSHFDHREVLNLLDMCRYLSITDTGDVNQGLDCCKAIAAVLAKLIERGRQFSIPEVIWNIFDRPNPPLEKRNSNSPQPEKLETQPHSFKRRLTEEKEDEETARSRRETLEREREKESHDDQSSKGSTSVLDGGIDAVVRLRGLPWLIKEDEIRAFFKDIPIPANGVYLEVDATGRRTGEGFVRFSSLEDQKEGLKCDHKHIGSRYIEVFASSLLEMEDAKNRKLRYADSSENVVKMRGLPFSVTESDIMQFFRGIKTSRDWIHIVFNSSGRTTGEAFVEFASDADLEKAMQRDREKIGSRYVELFRSTLAEMNAVLRKVSDGYGRGSGFPERAMGGMGGYNGSSGYQSYGSGGGGGYGSLNYSPQNYNGSGAPARDPNPSARVGVPSSPTSSSENFLRLRGLSYNTNEIDIMSFFATVSVNPIGVQLVLDPYGQPVGDAFVQLATPDDLRRGLTKHLHPLGGRNIDVSHSTTQEVVKTLGYDQRGGVTGGVGGYGTSPASSGSGVGLRYGTGFGTSVGGASAGRPGSVPPAPYGSQSYYSGGQDSYFGARSSDPSDPGRKRPRY